MRVKGTLTGAEYGKLRAGKIPAAVKKAQRASVLKIVREVAKDAKATVRKRTGLLAKSMGAVVRATKSETVIGIAGPRRGFKVTAEQQGKKLVGTTEKGKTVKLKNEVKAGSEISPTRYAHLVERRFPFLRPAAAKAGRTAKAEIVNSVNQAIQSTK
jgi:hypothetical protein